MGCEHGKSSPVLFWPGHAELAAFDASSGRGGDGRQVGSQFFVAPTNEIDATDLPLRVCAGAFRTLRLRFVNFREGEAHLKFGVAVLTGVVVLWHMVILPLLLDV